MNSLDNERTKIVDNLDDERKNALLDVYILSQNLMAKQVPADIATLQVGALNVLNHARILGKKTPFMIAYITPTVVTDKASGDYPVTVTGIGIGNQDGKDLPTSVTLLPPDGPAIPAKVSDVPNGIAFTIPRSALEKRFSNFGFYRMGVKINSTAPSSCGPVGLFTCDKPFSFTYSMVLFPNVALSGTITQIRTTPSTDHATRKGLQVSTTTANGDGNHMHTWATSIVNADPGYKILDVKLTGTDNAWNKPGNPCAFVYIDGATLAPQNDGASALITGKNNSWPCTLTFTAYEEKIIQISNPLPNIPIAFAAGETKQIDVAADAVSVLMNLTDVESHKSIIQIVPAGGLATDSLDCTGRVDIGSGLVQYLCKAKDVDYF